MARDLSEAAAIFKENGLDLTKIIQDTHAETMMRLGRLFADNLELALKAIALNPGSRLHVDSDEIIGWVKQLSTYDAAPDHQTAIFNALDGVLRQLKGILP